MWTHSLIKLFKWSSLVDKSTLTFQESCIQHITHALWTYAVLHSSVLDLGGDVLCRTIANDWKEVVVLYLAEGLILNKSMPEFASGS